MAAAKKPVKKPTGSKASAKKPASPKTAAKVKPSAKKEIVKNSKTVATKKATKKVVAPKAAPKAKTTKVVAEKPAKKVVAPKAPKVPDVFRCPISGIPVKAEKPNLSEKTIAKLKELLIVERKRHLAQADELIQEAADMIADREAGDTQFDEESGEGDSVAVERERTLFLAAEANNTVEQIDRALERIKNHSYGLCTPSGRRISVPRLEALPWTEVCVDCKARSERRR